MSTNANFTMYDTIPTVSELNKVPGFNPLKFLRKTDDGPKLDLKYKKLWFRLKYPSGRTKLTALRITEQLAIIEAKVYFDKSNPDSNGSYIATRYAQSTPGGLYIEAAQHDAMDAALTDAGFGIQFLSADPTGVVETTNILASEKEAAAAPFVADALKSEESVSPVKGNTPSAMESAAATEKVSSVSTVAEDQASHNAEAAPATAMAASNLKVEERTYVARDITSASVPAQAENMAAEAAPPVTHESFQVQAAPTDAPAEAPAVFTPDMPVDDICAVMTLDEAGNVIVPVGTCKGWTLSQVADRRPASLKWYLNGYNGDDNILRAGAKLMLAAISSMDKAG